MTDAGHDRTSLQRKECSITITCTCGLKKILMQYMVEVINTDFQLFNVLCEIVGNYLMGPFVLPDRLRGATYTQFLENNLRNGVDLVDLQLRYEMWFMHEGAPAHSSRQARDFPIGSRNGPIPWPVRSPDLNRMDFFTGSSENHGRTKFQSFLNVSVVHYWTGVSCPLNREIP
jgi:hypothetical protein